MTFAGTCEVAEDWTAKGFLVNGVEFLRIIIIDGGKDFYPLSMPRPAAFYGVGKKIRPPGVAVFLNYNDRRGNHVKIRHGLDSNKQGIYTQHFHVHGRLPKLDDRVERGQTLGFIGMGNRERADLPDYHNIVIKEVNPEAFAPLTPVDYWNVIDQYKEKLEKNLDVGPFRNPCFDANVNCPKEPIRVTYPLKCK